MDTKQKYGYSATVKIEYPNIVGMLGRVASAIGATGGDLGSIDIVSIDRNRITRDVNFYATSTEHVHQIIKKIRKIPHITIKQVTDRVFAVHHGGKIETKVKYPINNRDDLSLVYTPGVARVCKEIHDNFKHVFTYTCKGNTVAIVTDGTAVLGLGDIGPLAALPVMEGKAALFKEFADVNAFPICLDTKDPDEIVSIVKNIAPVFGGINLEDISAPRCFEIEEKLRQELDIPVFHDDQHGTAIVVLAALYNALKIVRKEIGEIRLAVSGAGAAGIACIKILISAGVDPNKIIVADEWGIIYRERTEGMDGYKQRLAEVTNPARVTGTIHDAIEGADVFLGVSAGNILTRKDIIKMAKNPIVFAMANPVPEISPEEAQPYARVMATGRSDYPNQINNVLCFPGFFKGLLNARAKTVTMEMKIAAARAIANLVKPGELNEDYIIPSVFDRRVRLAVARAVEKVARKFSD